MEQQTMEQQTLEQTSPAPDTPETPTPAKRKLSKKETIIGVIVLVVLWLGLQSCFSAGNSNNIPDDHYYEAAKAIISERLKNPATAVYNDAGIYEKDDYGRVIVYMDVSAQNGYGGYTRYDWWVCITGMDADGNYSYNKYFSDTTERGSLELLKSMNNFGEPKEE